MECDVLGSIFNLHSGNIQYYVLKTHSIGTSFMFGILYDLVLEEQETEKSYV